MQPLGKAFKGIPKTFQCQELKKKWLRSNPRRFVTAYQIGKLFRKYMQAAKGAKSAMAAGRQAVPLVT
jgi:hypothetical protein